MTRYAVILADPPWRYRAWKGDRGMRTAESFYPTMSAADLRDLGDLSGLRREGDTAMSARDTAIEYRSRGWAPIPIPWRDKNPGYVGWQHLRVTPETLGAHFNGVRQNIGVLLGEPSSWLVDIDLDCPEALVVAEFLLPDTGCIFGRSGNRDSHHLFVSKVATKKFVEPGRPDGNEGAMLVELRSTGSYTLFPGSAHPTGQLIEWTCDNGPAEIRGRSPHADRGPRGVRGAGRAALACPTAGMKPLSRSQGL
jgi:hypothetical protein